MEGNLPVHLTKFVGRDKELVDLGQLLREERLVTLVGAGGCGKTRLATEVAAGQASHYPDGTWFVDLSSITDPNLVPAAVASALGPTAQIASDTVRLASHLADRRGLLMLDNCEHLVDEAASLLVALAHSCPHLSLLATSREPLGVEGELVYRVGSLMQADAVRLFTDRAKHTYTAFDIGADSEAVEAICRRLDGLPLAIELAAACVGSMTPQMILEKLDERFNLLITPRGAIPRHRTLRAALEWSEVLLTEPERRLFRRVAVFVGAFNLAAAEAVTSDAELPVADVLPLLRRLVDRSLVVLLRGEAGEQYRLLETLRELASERLAASGEAMRMRGCHATYFAREAEPLYEAYYRGSEPERGRLERDVANFRAAIEYAAAIDPPLLVALVGLLTPLWRSRLNTAEGTRWMEIALPAARADSLERFRVLNGLSYLTRLQGDLDAASKYAAEALANRQTAGDAVGSCRSQASLVAIDYLSGRHAQGARRGESAIELARSTGDVLSLTLLLNHTAWCLMGASEHGRAMTFAREAVDLARSSRVSATRLSTYLGTLASVHFRRGELKQAMLLEREAMSNASEVWNIVRSLTQIAALLIANGQAEQGFRLAGAADRLSERFGLNQAQVWGLDVDWVNHGRKALGVRSGVVWDAGRRMSLEDACAYAMADADQAPAGGVQLSRRELEVATLVRQGLSNRRIAERLFISERTAEGHVASVLNKLGVDTRAEIAVWAVENLPAQGEQPARH